MHGRMDKRTLFTRTAAFCFYSIFLTYTSMSHASGFSVPGGLSIAGLGTADALVANPVEIGALAYNPAAMSFHEGMNLVLGLTAVWPDSNVTPEGESNRISDNPDSPIFIPNMYLMGTVADNWTLGLGANTPFGLETNWPAGTFPEFSGALAPFEPTKSRLEMLNLNPNMSCRIKKMPAWLLVWTTTGLWALQLTLKALTSVEMEMIWGGMQHSCMFWNDGALDCHISQE